jgi:Raf kinase inhibitor-like YbhB/YbcL family protein
MHRSPRAIASLLLPLAALAAATLGACRPAEEGSGASPAGKGVPGMNIESTAFAPDGEIPRKYTCEGDDVSPPLSWSGIPAGARSLVLIVDDPDAPDPAAPRTTWVHWVLYDLPPSVAGLPEAAGPPSAPARSGLNDWRKAGYGGPCPPIGRHRYFHKLYALDREIGDLGAKATKADVVKAMEGHVLAETRLVGTYQKGR